MRLGLAASAAVFSLACVAAARAAPADPIASAPLGGYIERTVAVDVVIDGQPARMMLDTGGGVTGLSAEFAARVGCKPYGAIAGFRKTGQRLDVQKCGRHKLKLGAYEAEVDTLFMDVAKLLPPGSPPIDGVLSLDAFQDQAVTLDLQDRRFVVESAGSLAARTQGRPAGEIRVQREMGGWGITAFAKVAAKTGDLWFLLDNSNMARVLVSPGALQQLGYADPAIEAALADPKATAPIQLNVDGAEPTEANASAKPIIYDGSINERYMFQYEVTFDLKNRKVWFVRDPAHAG